MEWNVWWKNLKEPGRWGLSVVSILVRRARGVATQYQKLKSGYGVKSFRSTHATVNRCLADDIRLKNTKHEHSSKQHTHLAY